MPENTLVAEERTAFGKGAARAVRRAHKVPAVLYGHGLAPKHLSLPGHELMLALKHGGVNALLTLKIGTEEQLVLPKAVTRDPIKGFLEHVDLLVVRRGEQVTVEVPLTLTGETTADVVVNQPLNTLTVTAEATHIPSEFQVDVAGILAGTTIHARDVVLPRGVTLHIDPEAVVVSAQAAATAEQLEADLAGSLAEAAGVSVAQLPGAAEAADGGEAAAGGAAEGAGGGAPATERAAE